jgi:hypothetical protein
VPSQNYSKLCITGDYNCKEIDWSNNTVTASQPHFSYQIFDLLNDLFLVDCVKQHTRFRALENASSLDWVLTNSWADDTITNMIVSNPIGKSDHGLISFDIECQKREGRSGNRLSFYRGDYESMRAEMNKDWESELAGLDTQQTWQKISTKVKGVIERYIPRTKYTMSKRPLWCNRAVKREINNKNKMWRKYRSAPSPTTWLEYTQARNTCNRAVNNAKNTYENEVAKEIKVNPKKFWQFIKKKTTVNSNIPNLIDDDDNEISDEQEKAEVFNKQFSSVFTQENQNRPNLPDIPNLDILEDIHITVEDIRKLLSKLDVNKSSGPDNIPARVLKELANELSPALQLLFSRSLSEGHLPTDWKEAAVIPLFKKGRKNQAKNYRPVSLTSVTCKVFEKIIRQHIVNHLLSQGLISKDQFGFLSGRSCSLQLLTVMELWTSWWDRGLAWDTVYTDFAKAFDSVPHQKLLYKIHRLGIRGNVFRWIEDFLLGRKQKVIVGQSESEWARVISGIPQGSVLGPILFLIFINDMPDKIKSHLKMFADDTKLFRVIESISDYDILQSDLDSLFNWSRDWQLPFNVEKCKSLHYGKSNPNYTYNMDSKPLDNIKTESDLGVIFDNNLSFKVHINKMIGKANARVGMVKRCFNHLNTEALIVLYKTLIRPILEYCSSIWFPITQGQINNIEKVQRRATKIPKSISHLTYTDRLKKLNLTTLVFMKERADMVQAFKILKGIDNVDPTLFFQLDTGSTRGHSLKLTKPRFNTKIRQYSFSNRIITNWNRLGDATVESETINEFKTALEREWITHPRKYTYTI